MCLGSNAVHCGKSFVNGSVAQLLVQNSDAEREGVKQQGQHLVRFKQSCRIAPFYYLRCDHIVLVIKMYVRHYRSTKHAREVEGTSPSRRSENTCANLNPLRGVEFSEVGNPHNAAQINTLRIWRVVEPSAPPQRMSLNFRGGARFVC